MDDCQISLFLRNSIFNVMCLLDIILSQNDFFFTFYGVAMCRAKTKLNAKLEKRLHFTMHTSLQQAIENLQ